MNESGGINIIETMERNLQALKTWIPQTQDEVWENIHNKKLLELIEKRIEEIGKHESLHGVFNDYVKPELQKLLKECKE